MTRCRCFMIAFPLAELLVGPLVTIVSYILRWPLHLSNSYYFIHYVSLLQVSALLGLLGSVACGVVRCRASASAWIAGGMMLVLLGTPELVMALRGTLPPFPLWRYAGDLVAHSLSAAATGYLTARWAPAVAGAWERWAPPADPETGAARSKSQRCLP